MTDQITTCETQFGKLSVLKNDFIGKWLLNPDKKYFEIECIQPLICLLNKGDYVFDIGANIGCYTIPFAQTVGANFKVYAFEPQHIIRNILKQNINDNNLQKIATAYHMAVGHCIGNATLNGKCDQGKELDYDKTEQTNFGGVNIGLGGETIPMISIDEFVEGLRLEYNGKKVKMIKIDVEGAEQMVIYGARITIERDRPIVFYEDNYKKLTKDMIEMFNLPNEIINFNIYKYFKDELQYSKIEKIKENYLCIP